MIVPGDLVVVVRCCCPQTEVGLGWVFTVGRVSDFGAKCVDCLKPFEGRAHAQHPRSPTMECAPLAWLKKIPPLTEEEPTEGVESVDVKA